MIVSCDLHSTQRIRGAEDLPRSSGIIGFVGRYAAYLQRSTDTKYKSYDDTGSCISYLCFFAGARRREADACSATLR